MSFVKRKNAGRSEVKLELTWSRRRSRCLFEDAELHFERLDLIVALLQQLHDFLDEANII